MAPTDKVAVQKAGSKADQLREVGAAVVRGRMAVLEAETAAVAVEVAAVEKEAETAVQVATAARMGAV